MPRRVFLSYHHRLDAYRASQVRQSGLLETADPASDDDWAAVTQAGEGRIRDWIDGRMQSADCVIVLIGQITAGRKWIDHEIRKAWEDGRGLFGIHIHNMKNLAGSQTSKGANPFAEITVDGIRGALAGRVRAYDPPYMKCGEVSRFIADNLPLWVELAMAVGPRGDQRRSTTRKANAVESGEAGVASRIE